MKSFFLICITAAVVSQHEATHLPYSTKSNSLDDQNSYSKAEFDSINSLSSRDVVKDSKKYVSSVYKNVIKRHVDGVNDVTPKTLETDPVQNKTYPGYHETQNVMVIPPRNSHRKNRAIENYGTKNELKTNTDKIRNDTFGNNAYENVLKSLYLYQLFKSLKQSGNYDMYHYFNRPDTIPTETRIPAAKIETCERNNTEMCLEGHLPICTTGNIIYCAIEYDLAVDCSSKYSQQYCAKAAVPCINQEDSSCSETLLIPCVTKIYVDLKAIGVYLRFCGVTYSVKNASNGKTDYNKNSFNKW